MHTVQQVTFTPNDSDSDTKSHVKMQIAGGYTRWTEAKVMHFPPPEAGREIIADEGTIELDSAARSLGLRTESLSLSGTGTGRTAYPTWGIESWRVIKAISTTGVKITPVITFKNGEFISHSPDLKTALLSVTYNPKYIIINYRAKTETATGGGAGMAATFGAVHSISDDIDASIQIPVPAFQKKQQRIEIFSIVSHYLFDENGACEMPLNYEGGNREYPGHEKKAPAKGEGGRGVRGHCYGYLTEFGNLTIEHHQLQPMTPYENQNQSYKPEYFFKKAAPPQDGERLKQYNKVNIDQLREELADDYKGLK